MTIGQAVPIYSSAREDAPVIAVAGSGHELELITEHEESWYAVQLPNGRIGWIRKGNWVRVERVEGPGRLQPQQRFGMAEPGARVEVTPPFEEPAMEAPATAGPSIQAEVAAPVEAEAPIAEPPVFEEETAPTEAPVAQLTPPAEPTPGPEPLSPLLEIGPGAKRGPPFLEGLVAVLPPAFRSRPLLAPVILLGIGAVLVVLANLRREPRPAAPAVGMGEGPKEEAAPVPRRPKKGLTLPRKAKKGPPPIPKVRLEDDVPLTDEEVLAIVGAGRKEEAGDGDQPGTRPKEAGSTATGGKEEGSPPGNLFIKIGMVLVRPSRFFSGLPRRPHFGPALVFALACSLIAASVTTIVQGASLGSQLQPILDRLMAYPELRQFLSFLASTTLTASMVAAVFVATVLVVVVGLFIQAAIMHLGVRIVRGRAPYRSTYSVLAYLASTQFIPLIGLTAYGVSASAGSSLTVALSLTSVLWWIVSYVIGIRQVNGISTRRAVGAFFISLIIGIAILAAILAPFVLFATVA